MKGTAVTRKARFTTDKGVKVPEFNKNRNRVSEKFPTKPTKRKVYGK